MLQPRSALFLALLLAAPAAAEVSAPASVCAAEAPELDRYRLLRALSLDLRGDVPTPEEFAALDASESIPGALVDEWLDSEAFVGQALRHHQALLWNNVANLTLLAATTGLTKTGQLHWRRQTAKLYRGGELGCLDEPLETTPDGAIVSKLQPDGTSREGWIQVAPYWAPDLPIKVCGYDAQDAVISPNGSDCGTTGGFSDKGCGCGPMLRWCRGGDATARVLEAIAGDLDRRIAAIIRDKRPYTELFTSQTAYVNGPLVHFLRWQTNVGANLRYEPNPVPKSKLPDLTFMDKDTWIAVDLGPEQAGILTSPAFLLRFQTQRARANRFHNAFLCQPFQPPPGGIPFSSDKLANHPDLQLRSGCKYCHALLEPTASYWGRWTPNGIGWLSPAAFPGKRADCEACALTGLQCSAECKTFYITKATSPEELPFRGWLMAYDFLRPEHVAHVEEGPRLLAMRAIVDDRLPTCVARHAAEWLLGRAVQPEEEGWLAETTYDFVSGGFEFRDVVKAIVTSATYRRVR